MNKMQWFERKCSGIHTDPENGGKVQQDWRRVPFDDAEESSQWSQGNHHDDDGDDDNDGDGNDNDVQLDDAEEPSHWSS